VNACILRFEDSAAEETRISRSHRDSSLQLSLLRVAYWRTCCTLACGVVIGSAE
jgi:hypothetical protein